MLAALGGLFAASLLLPAGDLLAVARTDRALAWTIALELRLPRALLALLYGAALGATGAAVQALFGNPLASPDITGTSGGAALGAVVAAYLLGATTPWGFALGGIVLVLSGAAFSVVLALLFNLISDLTGGVRVTVLEEDPVPGRRRDDARPAPRTQA